MTTNLVSSENQRSICEETMSGKQIFTDSEDFKFIHLLPIRHYQTLYLVIDENVRNVITLLNTKEN